AHRIVRNRRKIHYDIHPFTNVWIHVTDVCKVLAVKQQFREEAAPDQTVTEIAGIETDDGSLRPEFIQVTNQYRAAIANIPGNKNLHASLSKPPRATPRNSVHPYSYRQKTHWRRSQGYCARQTSIRCSHDSFQ